MCTKSKMKELKFDDFIKFNVGANFLYFLILTVNYFFEVQQTNTNILSSNSLITGDLWLSSVFLSFYVILFKNLMFGILLKKELIRSRMTFYALMIYGYTKEALLKNIIRKFAKKTFYSSIAIIAIPFVIFLVSKYESPTYFVLIQVLKIFALFLALDYLTQILIEYRVSNGNLSLIYKESEFIDDESKYYEELHQKRKNLQKLGLNAAYICVIFTGLIFSIIVSRNESKLSIANFELFYIGYFILNFVLIMVIPFPLSKLIYILQIYNSSLSLNKIVKKCYNIPCVGKIKNNPINFKNIAISKIITKNPVKISQVKVFLLVFSLLLIFNGVTTLKFQVYEGQAKKQLYFDQSTLEINLDLDSNVTLNQSPENYLSNVLNTSLFEEYTTVEYGTIYQREFFIPQYNTFAYSQIHCAFINFTSYERYVDLNNVGISKMFHDSDLKEMFTNLTNNSIIISSAYSKSYDINVNDILNFTILPTQENAVEIEFEVKAIFDYAPLIHLDEVFATNFTDFPTFVPHLICSDSIVGRNVGLTNIFAKTSENFPLRDLNYSNIVLSNNSIEEFKINTEIPENYKLPSNSRLYFLLSIFPIPFLFQFMNLFIEEYLGLRKGELLNLTLLGYSPLYQREMCSKDISRLFFGIYWISIFLGIITSFSLHTMYEFFNFLLFPNNSEVSISDFLREITSSRGWDLAYLGRYIDVRFEIVSSLALFILLFFVFKIFIKKKMIRRF